MIPFSVLDLSPINQGSTAAQAFNNSKELAQRAEALGYKRYWLAEHHNMPGIASAATSLVISHVAANTKTIRVGSGGIMLPNHSPLVIAEQFGTLESLYPGRIDLGLGRAPGSDQKVSQAIRRSLSGGADQFPRDVLELQAYFAGDDRLGIQATPGEGANIPLWILGSSLYGAQLAAALGLPYAFASHFAPAALDEALAIYRRDFRPSAQLDRPYAMAGYNIFAADSAAEAELIASSMQQAFVRLRTGQPGKLQPPLAGYYDSLPMQARAMLSDVLSASSIGTQADVERDLAAFIDRTGVDEVIIAAQIFDPAARKRSYEIAMAAAQAIAARELA